MRKLMAGGDETEQKTALSYSRIPNQQSLKRVIIVDPKATLS